MIFLIEYDRRRGKIVTLTRFTNAERAIAAQTRLDLEIRRNREELDREIVILDAASETALRQTHRRYFENTREIIESTSSHS